MVDESGAEGSKTSLRKNISINAPVLILVLSLAIGLWR
jgi:hypothetical protein